MFSERARRNECMPLITSLSVDGGPRRMSPQEARVGDYSKSVSWRYIPITLKIPPARAWIEIA